MDDESSENPIHWTAYNPKSGFYKKAGFSFLPLIFLQDITICNTLFFFATPDNQLY